MLFVSDFFTRHKEAVSNQIEFLAKQQSGKVLAASRFMGQKVLRPVDMTDRIYVVPPLLYPVSLMIALATSRAAVHSFEEESFWWKTLAFNLSRRPLHVSMYRRPENDHIKYLKRYKHLKRIHVELPVHKEMLIKHGFDPSMISIAPTPAKLERKRSTKTYNPSSVNILFASWNNSEPNALHDRGLIYLLDLLVANPGFTLTIPLRDSNTDEFWQIAHDKEVAGRINLLEIGSAKELSELFDKSDFVAFVAQDRVVKDVPNSLIDGLSYGKPVIISDVLDFSTSVSDHDIGIVVPAGEGAKKLSISRSRYKDLSDKAFDYSVKHTNEAYHRAISNPGEHP